MNYPEISKQVISSLHQSYNSLKNSPLDQKIRVLVELRVSQINGCEYCCELHAKEAMALKVPQEKLNALLKWETSDEFTTEETAALRWAEELTLLKDERDIKVLTRLFTERQMVDLTACISIMNALNRIAMSLRD